MLRIELKGEESWNEETQEFVYSEPRVFDFEHSLLSLSKWEQKYHKAFLKTEMTPEETMYYIRCMCLEEIDDESLLRITSEHGQDFTDYINDPATATTVHTPEHSSSRGEKIVTAELIYYWMIESNIWLECQTWPLQRLLTLIRVVNVKRTPAKKQNPSTVARRNRELNAARRSQLGTRG